MARNMPGPSMEAVTVTIYEHNAQREGVDVGDFFFAAKVLFDTML